MYRKRYGEIEVLKLYLGDYSRRLYLREISNLSRMPLRNTQRVLEGLERSRILRSEVNGKNKYFSLNLENIETRSMLLQAEVARTSDFLERYPAFRTFLKEMRTMDMVIVFGSFADSRAGKDSDVDIMIVSDNKAEMPFHLLPHKPHEIRMKVEAFKKAWEKGETLIVKIMESHVILNNHSLFVNMMWERYAG